MRTPIRWLTTGLAAAMRLLYGYHVEGLENLPRHGPCLLLLNEIGFMGSLGTSVALARLALSGRMEEPVGVTVEDALAFGPWRGVFRLGQLLAVPPGAQQVEPLKLPLGALVPAAYASISSDIPGEIISAAVAVGRSNDPKQPGLIMEYSARGHKEDIEEIVRDMAREGMRTRGVDVGRLDSISAEFKVKTIGVALAAVILWDEQG